MEPKFIIVSVFKLLLCGLLFFVGMIVGSMVAQVLGIQAVAPEGLEPTSAMLALLLTAPVLALGVALLARGIGGERWTRVLVLSWFAWVVYGLNTALETLIIMPAQSFWFNSLSSLVASVFLGTAVALLFRAPDSSDGWQDAWRMFWRTRKGGEWLVLFLLACLPLLVMWQKSERALILSLGRALFLLVGLVPLLAGYWLPLIIRVTHSLEILADEFVYAWVLVKLLQKGRSPELPADRSTQLKSGTRAA